MNEEIKEDVSDLMELLETTSKKEALDCCFDRKDYNQQSLGVSPILSKSANQNQYWKGETMKEVYWKELLEIFESDEELKVNHETLYKNIRLIVKANDTHKELEELNKELTELNK